MAELSAEERTAKAQKLVDGGDTRPLSQIEAEMVAMEEAGQERDADGVVVEKGHGDEGKKGEKDGKKKD